MEGSFGRQHNVPGDRDPLGDVTHNLLSSHRTVHEVHEGVPRMPATHFSRTVMASESSRISSHEQLSAQIWTHAWVVDVSLRENHRSFAKDKH